MKIRATGPLVVLRKAKVEAETYKGSVLIRPDTYESRDRLENQIGKVHSIGAECWSDEGQPRCAVGDWILHERYQGHWILDEETGDHYKFLNDRDILGIIDEFEKEVK